MNLYFKIGEQVLRTRTLGLADSEEVVVGIVTSHTYIDPLEGKEVRLPHSDRLPGYLLEGRVEPLSDGTGNSYMVFPQHQLRKKPKGGLSFDHLMDTLKIPGKETKV